MDSEKDKTTQDAQEALGDPDIYIQSTATGYKAFLNSDGSINWDKMTPEATEYYKNLPEGTLSDDTKRIGGALQSISKEILYAFDEISNSDKSLQWQQLKEIFPDIDILIDTMLERQGAIGAALFWLLNFLPMLTDIKDLQDYIKEIDFNGSYLEFIQTTRADPETGKPELSLYAKWLENREYKDLAETVENSQALFAVDTIDSEDALTAFENIVYNYPDNYIFPSNKIVEKLPALVDKGPTSIIMGHYKNSNTPIKARVELKAPKDMDGVSIYGNITEFDLSVMGSVCTIWEAGYNFMTSDMLARVVSSNPDVNPKKGFIKTVEESFTKMRLTDVQYDVSNLATSAKYNIEDPKRRRNMLYAVEDERKVNGRTVNGYLIMEEPILLHLSKELGQIQTTPIEYREIKKIKADGKPGKTIPATVPRIAIRDYLINAIHTMQSDIKTALDNFNKYNARRKKNKDLPEKSLKEFRHVYNDNVILYDTLFTACDLENQSRQTRINNILYVKDCLNFWIYEGMIKGYKEQPGKRKDTARGVQIKL